MKKTMLSIALALVAPFAWGQTSSTTTTTTTTQGSGTITEFTPGSVIVLKETSGPRRYRFGKTVTYMTKSGKRSMRPPSRRDRSAYPCASITQARARTCSSTVWNSTRIDRLLFVRA